MLVSSFDLLNTCVKRFGKATVEDIQRVYSSLWGRDTYRWKEQPLEATPIPPQQILAALLEIAGRNDHDGYLIAVELAEALRYSRGVVDPQNIMQPISPTMLFDIADVWRANLDAIDIYLQNRQASDLTVFRNLWAEWNTYLALISRAQSLTGLFTVDSFSGIAHSGSNGQHHSESERQAHCEYEKADLIAFKNLNKLMRIQPADIEEMLRRGNWDELLRSTVLAYLFGEGRFYQSLQMLRDAYLSPKIAQQFSELFRSYVDALQLGYRRAHPLNEVDISVLTTGSRHFLAYAQPVQIVEPIDFDEAWMVRCQKHMRIAEKHIGLVERQYFHYQAACRPPYGDPADLYEQAMSTFVMGLERSGLTIDQVSDLLSQYRQQLLEARAAADSAYKHDYYFWHADGEPLQQVKSRSLHPRYQFYHVEAYAERLFLAAFLSLRDCQSGRYAMAQFDERYQGHFNFDEASLYAQQWIATYGPRRAALFGYEAPPTISENAGILAQDRWIYKVRLSLLKRGAARKLWGAIATGYTERLRHLILLYSTPEEIASLPLAGLVRAGEIEHFTQIVRDANSYEGEIHDNTATTPLVTAGVHIHNANPKVIFETLVHVRELVWPHHAHWTLIGTTTTQPEIAEREHQFALQMGITRFGITNRQLLKAGNQNRIIPNTPMATDRESCYLTLDDDYNIAPLALRRAVPVLQRYPKSRWIQFNLLLRASIEPGHTHGRHFDALGQHCWTMTNVFSFQDTEIALPLGTNTLFRTTPGNNELALTGGFIVDPRYVVNGEDFAQGVISYTMHLRPDLFAEFAHPMGEIEQSWQYGIYIPEVWAIGDGVDFGAGNHRQKSRYAEINTRIFQTIWLRFLWRHLRTPSRQFRGAQRAAFVILTYQLSEIYLTVLTTTLSFLIVPALAFTSYFDELDINPYLTLNLCILWALWLLVGAYLKRPLNRLMGFSWVDVFSHTWMVGYGSLFAWVEGWLKGVFLRPGNQWNAYKGTSQANRFRLPQLALSIYHIVAVCYSLTKGIPIFIFLFLSGTMFGMVWFLQELPPVTPQEKIAKLVRDARQTSIKQMFIKFTHGDSILGTPAKPLPLRQARWLQYFVMPSLMAILILIAIFVQELPLFFRFVLVATSILNFLSLQVPFWNQVRTLDRRQELQRRVSGATKAEIIGKLTCTPTPSEREHSVLAEVTEFFLG